MPVRFEKGHVVSEITRFKISQKLKGNKNGLGHKCTNKEQLRKLQLGKPKSQETKDKISSSLTGKKHSLERRIKKSKMSLGRNNYFWKHGMSKVNKTARQLAMNTLEYKLWREAVFKRDNYTCVVGGKKHGDRLNADHIKSWAEYPELRFDVNNGQTLCVDCHRKTDSYSNRNKAYGLSTRFNLTQ